MATNTFAGVFPAEAVFFYFSVFFHESFANSAGIPPVDFSADFCMSFPVDFAAFFIFFVLKF